MRHKEKRKFVGEDYDDIGRIYLFENDVNYYSVTTALSNTANKEFLVRWRARLGDAEADRQVVIAQRLGTAFHSMGENLFLGKPFPEVDAVVKIVFKNLLPKLRPITKIHAVEDVVYSDMIRLSGRPDAVVDWNGELTILDFKFLNFTNPEWLGDYWLQCCIYAHCWNYLYGVFPTKSILAIGNKKTFKATVYEKNTRDFIIPATQRISEFHRKIENL